jgi:hypothetical protein
MPRGKHPNSKANLTHEGRPRVYGESKESHSVRVTPTGWDGLQSVINELGIANISELLEYLGRKKFDVVPRAENNPTINDVA